MRALVLIVLMCACGDDSSPDEEKPTVIVDYFDEDAGAE